MPYLASWIARVPSALCWTTMRTTSSTFHSLDRVVRWKCGLLSPCESPPSSTLHHERHLAAAKLGSYHHQIVYSDICDLARCIRAQTCYHGRQDLGSRRSFCLHLFLRTT